MTIPAGYIIGGQQLPEDSVVGSLEIKFEANNTWDTGNELTVTAVPVVVVSGNQWKAEVNYDSNTGGTSANIDVKNNEAGLDDDIRTHTIKVSPPSGDSSPGSLTLELDRTTDGGNADFSDYEDPDVNESTEIFTLTLYDHPTVTLGGSDVTPTVNLMTNPNSKGVFRWLAEQNTAIDLEGFFGGLAGNQAVVIKSGSSSSSGSEGGGGGGGSGSLSLIYGETFDTAAGSEWSVNTWDDTPIGFEGFLGQLGTASTTLTLNSLGAHTEAVVEFDLYVIGSWDGNNLDEGPDLWSLTVVGEAAPLINTTFSNGLDSQAFPQDYNPGINDNIAQGGAAETGTLGYSADSVYHLQFTFDHSSSTLGLQFAGSFLTGVANDTWGLDNVQVSIR